MYVKKSYLFIFLFFLFQITTFGQSIQKYYILVNEAILFEDKNELIEAKNAYLKALKIYNKDYNSHLELASISLKLNDTRSAEKHLKMAIGLGVTMPRLTNDSSIAKYFKAQPKWDIIYDKLRFAYSSSIPYQDERIELITMLESGEGLRRLLGVLDFKKVDSLIHISDTLNMNAIYKMITRIEFPDRTKVGKDGCDALFITLMHTFNDGVRDKEDIANIEPLIKKAVLEGKFEPFHYAILIDRNRGILKQPQVFGTYWEYDRINKKQIITAIENIKEVDKRREQIGLPKLIYSKRQGLTLPIEYDNY